MLSQLPILPRLVFAFLFALAALVGCGRDTVSPTTDPTPGEFSFTRLTNLGKRLTSTTDVVRSLFLDTVSNTYFSYFLVENKGDINITGVRIITTNPSFHFSPDSFDVLEPRETSSVLPVLKLTVAHGTHPSGVGNTTVLDTGMNTTQVAINGSTRDNRGQSQSVTFQIDLSVYAKLVDMNFLNGLDTIDMSHPTGSSTSNFPGIHDVGTMPWYSVNYVDSLRVENTGNVDVGILTWQTTNTSPQSFELPRGASLLLPPTMLVVEVDCRNVIALPTKFSQDPNGYFQVEFFHM